MPDPNYYEQMMRGQFANPNYSVPASGTWLQLTPSDPSAWQALNNNDGWKFRISCHPDDVANAWNIVVDELMKDGNGHCAKVAQPHLVSEFSNPANSQAGKMITIYTGSDISPQQYKSLMQRIENRLSTAGIRKGLSVKGDRPIAGSDYASYRNDKAAGGGYNAAANNQGLSPDQAYNPAGYHDPYQNFQIDNPRNLPNRNVSNVRNTPQSDARIAQANWLDVNDRSGGSAKYVVTDNLTSQQQQAIQQSLDARGISYELKHSSLNGGCNVIAVRGAGTNEINVIQRTYNQSIISRSSYIDVTDRTGQPAKYIDLTNITPQQQHIYENALKSQGINYSIKNSSLNGGMSVIAITGNDVQKIKSLQISDEIKASTRNQQQINSILQSENTFGFMDEATGTQHFVDRTTGSVVTVAQDGSKSLQAFNSVEEGMHHFGRLVDSAGRKSGKIPQIVEGGLEVLAEALEHAGSRWGKFTKGLGKVGKFFGKVSKVLGPIGIVAATAEITTLEAKASSSVEFGLVPEKAMLEYDAMLAAHLAQATVDPSLVGGEVVVQEMFGAWADKYNIPPYLRKELEPGSLLKTIFGASADYKGQPIPKKDPLDNSMPRSSTSVNTILPIYDLPAELKYNSNSHIEDCRTPIEKIQDAIGVKADNVWGPKTTKAFAVYLAEIQLSDQYKKLLDDCGAAPDCIYGPKTKAAMKALGYDQNIIDAIDELDQNGQLDQLYHGPENWRETLEIASKQLHDKNTFVGPIPYKPTFGLTPKP